MSVMILLWSANFIIGKVALREFPPVLLGALRIGLAGLFVAPVCWRKVRAASDPLRPRRDWFLLAFLAACNVGNQLLFLIGLNRTSVAHSTLILATGPIFVLLIAARIGLERITWRKAVGMAIALAGIAVLVQPTSAQRPPGSGRTDATLAGDAVTAAACVLFSMFAVYGKKATKTFGTVVINGFTYMGGAVLLAPIVLWQARDFPFSQVTAAGWSSLVYIALIPSIICYLIYYHALAHISASRVAAFIYFEPLIAMLMAVPFLGERITPSLVASGTVIFTGVYLTERG
jgi:drug/metabolite transporter (DMT)-like permease